MISITTEESAELMAENEEFIEDLEELKENESRQSIQPCRDCDLPEGLDF